MERRTGTAGSGFSTSAGSGSVPILLSWPATAVMSAATSDGAVLLFETYAETISTVSSAVLRV
jgi:hypothetical protein